jgi:hypothetical protein
MKQFVRQELPAHRDSLSLPIFLGRKAQGKNVRLDGVPHLKPSREVDMLGCAVPSVVAEPPIHVHQGHREETTRPKAELDVPADFAAMSSHTSELDGGFLVNRVATVVVFLHYFFDQC